MCAKGKSLIMKHYHGQETNLSLIRPAVRLHWNLYSTITCHQRLDDFDQWLKMGAIFFVLVVFVNAKFWLHISPDWMHIDCISFCSWKQTAGRQSGGNIVFYKKQQGLRETAQVVRELPTCYTTPAINFLYDWCLPLLLAINRTKKTNSSQSSSVMK